MANQKAASATPPSRVGKWSNITEMPLPAQKQLKRNLAALEASPYMDFVATDLEVPTEAALSVINRAQLSPEQTLSPSIADLNRLISPGYSTAERGYAVLDGPTTYAQSRIVMPEVTVEMMQWWFTWHPLASERYMLWFPHAHISTSIVDPERLANASLSYEQRFYNNPNHISEYIGSSVLDVTIHFTDPVELGFDADLLKQQNFTFSASGLASPGPDPGLDTMMALLVHLGRDTPEGFELLSRYWIGPHPELARFKGANEGAALYKKMGFNAEAAEGQAYDMLVHDMTEFNHLSRVLPSIYKKFAQ